MKDVADLDPARRDAPAAARHWLAEAVRAVDETFGEGYAARNPALVASLVQASAIDAAVSAGRETSAEINETVTRTSREMNATILKLKPRLFG